MPVDEADRIAGMTPTGRRIAAPAAELIEVADDRGLKHLVLKVAELHRGHPSMSDLQIGWMEDPGVTGLARLAHHDPDEGTFAYATGTCFTVAEIVRIYAEEETGAGVKAGLELCYLIAETLSEASEGADELGVFSHGNLNPWNIVVKPDAQPLILGYGLPQVELAVWRDDPRQVPREDSFRYVPPERIEGHDEDIASDIFTLALIGLEVMVGRPVYDGLLDDIRQQATRGEGMRRLYQWRDQLPANVREVLGRALKPDPDTRYRRGLDFVYAVHDLLGSIDVEGPSLMEVMARVRAVSKRGKGPIIGGKTGMLTPEELAELAADLDEVEVKPLPPPRLPRPEEPQEADADEDESNGDKPRWSRRKSVEPPEPEDPKAAARDRLKRRLRRSGTAPGAAPTGGEADARDRLRRRLRESASRQSDTEARRRLRRSRDEAPERRVRRREESKETSGVSQSIELGEPVGFDGSEERTDIDLAPVDLPDLPDEEGEEGEEKPTEIGRVVASSAPDEVETAVAPLATSGGAAALLQRLRSSTGERRSRRRRTSPSSDDFVEDEATAVVERPRRSPPPAPPPPPPPEPEPEPEPEPSAEELEPERVVVRASASPEPPGPRLPPSDFLEEPPAEPLTATVELAEPEPRFVSDGSTVRVEAPDGRHLELEVSDDDSVGAIVQRAVTRLELQQVDLQGRPRHAWRGRVGESPLPGFTVAKGIERLTLVAQPCEDHALSVEWSGQRIHLELPGAVTVASVLPALAALFGVQEPVVATFASRPLPSGVLVGELVRKPLVLVRSEGSPTT